eukprot:451921-Ditylum_brightwellii.AAC.1
MMRSHVARTIILLLSILCASVAAQEECTASDTYIFEECCRAQDWYGLFCYGDPIPNCQVCDEVMFVMLADLWKGTEHLQQATLSVPQKPNMPKCLKVGGGQYCVIAVIDILWSPAIITDIGVGHANVKKLQ